MISFTIECCAPAKLLDQLRELRSLRGRKAVIPPAGLAAYGCLSCLRRGRYELTGDSVSLELRKDTLEWCVHAS
jgi:hypothetical protein